MAVTKTQPASRILEAYEAGQRLFGENRVQEFEGKAAALGHLPDAEFHMIGHLQSNKAGKAVEIFRAIDSLDSAKLGHRLNAAAGSSTNGCRPHRNQYRWRAGQERHRPGFT